MHRYIPAFEGVVLAHSNLHFLDHKATIKADCPYAVCNVGFDATVWSPHIGMKLGTSVTPSKSISINSTTYSLVFNLNHTQSGKSNYVPQIT